ncbi:FMN reductase [Corynebacterium guangdongense]|uniref:FMN reductase n=1 Tax=Corynebacterium guangdongense TaxID=1783348 RepID=A0ABU1ZWY2_9CORY|nr:FMN reductase [Corynebacterium guangdongense]MDR7329447.1 FMN reductase [Corynebacterium guangdongense]WJZ18012.1 FMN reductase (NADPH) [Corynebacterium guangdongense]
MRTLVVVTAGLSNPSSTRNVADRIAQAVQTAVSSRGEALQVRVVEVREYINDLAHVMSTGMSTEKLDKVKTELSDADALIAVTPVFQASYSGLFKMFFDVLDTESLNGMPTIIAATAGSSRHALVLEYALRPLFVYLRTRLVTTGLFAATEDFGSSEGAAFEKRVQRAAGELADMMITSDSYTPGFGGATVEETRRPRKSGVDVTENLTPFSQLLKGLDGSGK